ncbi:sporulation peptidase YabG [Paenibacillus darwinianus]|uniref:Sporulation peptidase YabG n=1 Tax=Paenibacillus darwinianus TaxID=1380763 RepID=A0A9W5W6P7_9BACL|nr:sporulation peptidase YabG [Paenibacillus darwinianus]EXX86125.1 sporulation peptidase YabG [Paenibacillus darwinianus]EXX86339.1 sporulation peptidase YabG [Paenibacillus darwinianus]EXX88517.1 sporulation peptidase YabG [Paenibacillus darwinianus]
MRQGDFVVRKSYGGDVLFRIDAFGRHSAILKGTDYRLLADAPFSDLEVVEDPESTGAVRAVRVKEHETMRRFQQQSERPDEDWGDESPGRGAPPTADMYFEIPGRVLHLDGDGLYMRKSMQLYGQLRVPAHGVHAHESQMPDLLRRLLPRVQPDIVVITGHDGVLKNPPGSGGYTAQRSQEGPQHLSSYKNSLNFVNAVRVAREYDRNRDSLIVVAGACQSHFEALLQAGANFASSPGRILIHALDPVYIAVKASQTSIRDTISLADIVRGTISGADGVGGIETMGKHRIGLPRPKAMPKAIQN